FLRDPITISLQTFSDFLSSETGIKKEKNSMKKDYQKPMLISEEFIPNEYVAACYNFKALFHCHYGENNTNNHGEPCATTYVDINGIHATGHEGTIEKWGIPILNIDWNGFDLSDAKVGDKIRGIKWTS